jgi:hypothetical protein
MANTIIFMSNALEDDWILSNSLDLPLLLLLFQPLVHQLKDRLAMGFASEQMKASCLCDTNATSHEFFGEARQDYLLHDYLGRMGNVRSNVLCGDPTNVLVAPQSSIRLATRSSASWAMSGGHAEVRKVTRQ